MVLVSGGAPLNILLNYIMAGRLGLGLTGTAQATLMAEGMVCLLGLGYFFTPYARLRLSWRQLRPTSRPCRTCCSPGYRASSPSSTWGSC